ncbi:ETC complex I subunit conserved region-domain-containing protein [Durotheca rogersii]|uniref:ETC complex I subunit conserved region-domain-containing protein n=1 Tax=Durotheca rogersii TaxID=419775 RepID=UPI00222125EF|nr:ETC complex I subunit conserved region-domain-containing protein [Durotheca rogersii]KAI5861607.1 ETC complex I subunit conserved region-domain-containing protein [Durotheca rogersii]
MASLRNQAATAPRLLRTATLVPVRQAVAMSQRRLSSSGAGANSGGPRQSSSAALEPSAAPEERPRNAPDYGAPIDSATSTFTPVPKRVMDGTNEDGVLPAALISGAPMELQARAVRIYQPSKPATQSGTWGAHHWRMDWDVLARGHRWENPLMGWQSSGDYLQGTKLEFRTKEDAIAFARKQGYEYFVQEPNVRTFAPKAYANNFLYSPKKLKLIRAK